MSTRRFYWLPSVADNAAPTQAELDAGIELSAYVDDIDGWNVDCEASSLPAEFGAGFHATFTINRIDEVIEYNLDDSPDAFTFHPDDLDEYNDQEASRE
jgi:hypothetical protein